MEKFHPPRVRFGALIVQLPEVSETQKCEPHANRLNSHFLKFKLIMSCFIQEHQTSVGCCIFKNLLVAKMHNFGKMFPVCESRRVKARHIER